MYGDQRRHAGADRQPARWTPPGSSATSPPTSSGMVDVVPAAGHRPPLGGAVRRHGQRRPARSRWPRTPPRRGPPRRRPTASGWPSSTRTPSCGPSASAPRTTRRAHPDRRRARSPVTPRRAAVLPGAVASPTAPRRGLVGPAGQLHRRARTTHRRQRPARRTATRRPRDFTLGGRTAAVTVPLTGTHAPVRRRCQEGRATTDDVTAVITRNGTPVFAADAAGRRRRHHPGRPRRAGRSRGRGSSGGCGSTRRSTWASSSGRRAPLHRGRRRRPVTDAAGKPLIVVDPPYDLDMYPVDGADRAAGSPTPCRPTAR